MNVPVGPDGAMGIVDGLSKPGDHVELRAEMRRARGDLQLPADPQPLQRLQPNSHPHHRPRVTPRSECPRGARPRHGEDRSHQRRQDAQRAGQSRLRESNVPATRPDAGSAPGAGRSGSAFSIQDLTLRIPNGKTLVILGPSGCGKTTLLRIIAGLIPPDSGEVRYDDVDVKDVRPGDRRIGMVFQQYALYPHMTARSNVLSYFMFRKKTPELDAMAKAKYQRTSELMGVELAYLLDRKPRTLSGGEKQRVALGRCITRDPALFLLDEPFSNLDQALREKYRVNLKILLKQFNITTVYVTHDHHEALILADLLAIMNRGRIEQVGTYQDIYEQPQERVRGGLPEPARRGSAHQPHRGEAHGSGRSVG